ncbi:MULTISPECIES: GNAT family N-acetyltransferase [Rhizobium]|uniref:Phospholipid/glycerol acyltransferase n=1 Tax=Rhizobium favelukesii TaxID=348824 RepID=W6RKW8_9HYPH|nr:MULTISPECIES: 1-acyl-sn-glycerol-3-phosphate acyltransferase [Rhizobium]MCA0803555.1 1-acyl-sn-glycerol-3-phosphate acyltransferase [Rhizobium sp. T1473]MCS0461675.1 1-acyl-sn-glycerol-3-phosphate acyltransferase [Rhizobium favelukesii]UFS82859.1 1-acyl-sn-glycerol-3-phosphate acyltransferase [Rhizobium sp. T136]CDM59543.1 phospholipid/glycerol acyltransferase [Rhizobium favelukesii]
MPRRHPTTAFGQFAEVIALVSHGKPGHIVDTLIAERGQRIVKHPLWPIMRPFLHTLLRYHRAISFANDVANMPGFQCFEYMSNLLKLEINVRHGERIPDAGGFILVSNHPTGIADGVAVFDLLKSKRPDIMVFANRDAIRVNPRFAEVIIPVEWREEYKSKLKTRETLQITNRAVREGKATVLFPSGRIAYWANGRLNERPWKTSAVGLARKYNLPILPVHMTARNSGLFYWLAKWSTELRDMTVFHELLNKRGDRFDFVVGNLIPVGNLEGDINEVTKALEDHTVRALDMDDDAQFLPLVPPAEPELASAHSIP